MGLGVLFDCELGRVGDGGLRARVVVEVLAGVTGFGLGDGAGFFGDRTQHIQRLILQTWSHTRVWPDILVLLSIDVNSLFPMVRLRGDC